MADFKIASAVLSIDNLIIKYKSNTLKCDYGNGEVDVSTKTAGNGNTETVFGKNDETNVGRVMFELENDQDGIRLANTLSLRSRQTPSEIRIYQNNSGATLNFKGAVLKNNISAELTSDGMITVEYATDPVIIS